jgi:hypothetical protein
MVIGTDKTPTLISIGHYGHTFCNGCFSTGCGNDDLAGCVLSGSSVNRF